MPNATEVKSLRGTLSHCFKVMPISLFFPPHDNATSQTVRDTVNFFGANNIAFINDWPAKIPNLNLIEHPWDNLDQRVRRRPIPPSNVIQLRQFRNGTTFHKPKSIHIRSMCQRCQTVIHTEGGHTRY